MRLIGFIVLLLLFFFGGRGAEAATIDPDHLITEGVGIGPVHLGESIGDVVAVLGKPKSVQPFHSRVNKGWDGLLAWSWEDSVQDNQEDKARVIHGGLVVLTQDNIVRVVMVYYDGHYQDTNGLHTITKEHGLITAPGSRSSEVIAALGKPERTVTTQNRTVLVYPGIEFQSDVRDSVFEIAVVDK